MSCDLGNFLRLPHRKFRGIGRILRRLAACQPLVPGGNSCASSSFRYIQASAPSNCGRGFALPQQAIQKFQRLRRLPLRPACPPVPTLNIFCADTTSKIDVRARDLSAVARVGGKFFDFRANGREFPVQNVAQFFGGVVFQLDAPNSRAISRARGTARLARSMGSSESSTETVTVFSANIFARRMR